MKLERQAGMKGHFWAIDPDYEDMFDHGSFLRRRYRFKNGNKKDKSVPKPPSDPVGNPQFGYGSVLDNHQHVYGQQTNLVQNALQISGHMTSAGTQNSPQHQPSHSQYPDFITGSNAWNMYMNSNFHLHQQYQMQQYQQQFQTQQQNHHQQQQQQQQQTDYQQIKYEEPLSPLSVADMSQSSPESSPSPQTNHHSSSDHSHHVTARTPDFSCQQPTSERVPVSSDFPLMPPPPYPMYIWNNYNYFPGNQLSEDIKYSHTNNFIHALSNSLERPLPPTQSGMSEMWTPQ
jgi:hypothetical protein